MVFRRGKGVLGAVCVSNREAAAPEKEPAAAKTTAHRKCAQLIQLQKRTVAAT